MNDELREKLIKLAKRETRDDYVENGGASGAFYCGNEDDAYESGTEDGETDLAREVLISFGEKLPKIER